MGGFPMQSNREYLQKKKKGTWGKVAFNVTYQDGESLSQTLLAISQWQIRVKFCFVLFFKEIYKGSATRNFPAEKWEKMDHEKWVNASTFTVQVIT